MDLTKEVIDALIGMGMKNSGVMSLGKEGEDGGIPFVYLPKDVETHSLEKYLPHPIRKRAKIHVRDADSFISYVNKHNTGDAVVFHDIHDRKIKACLDYHSETEANHGDHGVVFNCPTTLEFGAWTAHNGKKMKQRDFAAFMEDNCKDVVEPSSADMLQIAQSFDAKRNVTFSSDVRLDNGDVKLEYVQETAASAAKGSIEIPEKFSIGIQVFENGKGYKVECRLKYRIEDGVLILWYEIINLDALLQEAFQAELDKVKAGIGEDVMFINGDINSMG